MIARNKYEKFHQMEQRVSDSGTIRTYRSLHNGCPAHLVRGSTRHVERLITHGVTSSQRLPTVLKKNLSSGSHEQRLRSQREILASILSLPHLWSLTNNLKLVFDRP